MSDAAPLAAPSQPRSPASATGGAVFIGILILAAVVRLAQLNAQSLSMDEVKDLELARAGVAKPANLRGSLPAAVPPAARRLAERRARRRDRPRVLDALRRADRGRRGRTGARARRPRRRPLGRGPDRGGAVHDVV